MLSVKLRLRRCAARGDRGSEIEDRKLLNYFAALLITDY